MDSRSQRSKIIFLTVGIILTGVGMRILSPPGKLDSKFLYDATYAQQFFLSLVEPVTTRYFWCEILDLIFMLLYTILLVLLFRMKFPLRIALLALIPGVLDLVETISIIIILIGGSVNLQFLSVVSALKWGSGVILLLTLGVKWFRHRFAA